EDDERTIKEDEALITKEEREKELAALQSEIDLPLEEILKRCAAQEGINISHKLSFGLVILNSSTLPIELKSFGFKWKQPLDAHLSE
ncbi:UNVERIFIED_CONTAM: hypothetical protein Sradi_6899600, partial [Sesamum radiatum]